MKIAWFTEGRWAGKVARTHPNMRNDAAWMCALGADHYCINDLVACPNDVYDLIIVTIPKNVDNINDKDNLLFKLRLKCKKIAYMQEGPHWYFQDYSLENQIWYYNILSKMDILFVHNYGDIHYYAGMFPDMRIEVMPTLMLTDNLNLEDGWADRRTGVMIGGNMCSWYGGFDSYIIAQEFNCTVYAPSMGRKISGEESLDITHYPFMPWHQWINELNKCKYAIHLMRTAAAGTFALNCAFLGIPCIGYNTIDTQETCFPNLSFAIGDTHSARLAARQLAEDTDYYNMCSTIAKQRYNDHFTEQHFMKHFKDIYDSII